MGIGAGTAESVAELDIFAPVAGVLIGVVTYNWHEPWWSV
jgi:hypothetical protein